jgi:uncharacterized membrane protein
VTHHPERPAEDGAPAGSRIWPSRDACGESGKRKRLMVFCAGSALLLLQLVLGLSFAYEATLEVIGLAGVSLLAVGKFLPLWGLSDQCSYSPWELGVVVWLMDTCTVLIILYAHGGLCRIAIVARWLRRARDKAALVRVAYPRVEKWAVTVVVGFVLCPLAGTGAAVGALLGIILGLHRHAVIAAVTAGGFLGGMLMACLAVHSGGAMRSLLEMQQHGAVKLAIVALVAACISAVLWSLSRAYRRAVAASRRRSSVAAETK